MTLDEIEKRLSEFSEYHATKEFSPLSVRPLVEYARKLEEIVQDLAEMAEWELVPLGPKLQSRAHTLIGKSKR